MLQAEQAPLAPELHSSAWLNCRQAPHLSSLRGKVILLHAFQMLCPGCVSHGLPQASAVAQYFDRDDLMVIGLHSVFEHHQVMNLAALKAFVAEYHLTFPIVVDQPSSDSPVPLTMAAYQLQGTPSLVLIDQQGRIRLKHFGRLNDLQVGAAIGQLLAETSRFDEPQSVNVETQAHTAHACDAERCHL